MTRWPLFLLTLLLLGAQGLDAQCRDSRGRRDRDCRDRDHDRQRSRTVVVHRTSSSHAAVQFGVRGGYDFRDEVGSGGAQFRVPLVPQVALSPSADVFFGDEGPDWQLNADLLFRPHVLAGVYGGIGAALVNREVEGFRDGDRDDDETEAGVNLVAGMEGGRVSGSTLRPFVELRWTLMEDDSPFRLVAGFNVPVSRGRF